jgi:hypothetical protein
MFDETSVIAAWFAFRPAIAVARDELKLMLVAPDQHC